MAIGTFLYPAITDKLGSAADSAKLNSNNTFTGNNTFNGTTLLTNTITFKNPSNNNGAFLQNFDYNSENYTALKFVKNNSTAMLIFEVNVNRNTATISSPTTNDHLYINNLAAPTAANQAANKGYVDNVIKYVEKAGGLTFTRQPLNTTAGQQVTKYYANVNYSTIPIPNGKHIISCYSKTIPVSGAHLVITFFPVFTTNQCVIEIYQYNSSTDITNQLNGATYCFTYLNI